MIRRSSVLLVVVALFPDLPEAFSDNHHGQVAAQMLAVSRCSCAMMSATLTGWMK